MHLASQGSIYQSSFQFLVVFGSSSEISKSKWMWKTTVGTKLESNSTSKYKNVFLKALWRIVIYDVTAIIKPFITSQLHRLRRQNDISKWRQKKSKWKKTFSKWTNVPLLISTNEQRVSNGQTKERINIYKGDRAQNGAGFALVIISTCEKSSKRNKTVIIQAKSRTTTWELT